MRPIDADALIEAVPAPHEQDETISRNAAIRDMMMLICDAPTITPALRWIPVTERLPEEDGWVLVYMDGRPGAPWEIVYSYGGRWALGCQAAKSVTHWMPLPAPPKEAN